MRARGNRSRRAAAVERRRASPQNRNRRTSGSRASSKLRSARHRSANDGVDVHTSTPESRRSANSARRSSASSRSTACRQPPVASAPTTSYSDRSNEYGGWSRNTRPPSRITGNVRTQSMKRATLSAPTSMPFGRPVEPDVKMRYCASSPVTQLARSGTTKGLPAAATAVRASSTSDSGSAHARASGMSSATTTSASPSWDRMSARRVRGISVSTGTNACPLLRQPRNPATIHADLWPSTTAGCRFSVRAAKAAAMRSEASHSSAYVVVRPFGALWAGACGCSRTCCSTARKNSFSLLMLILPQLPLSNGKNLGRISQ